MAQLKLFLNGDVQKDYMTFPRADARGPIEAIQKLSEASWAKWVSTRGRAWPN